MSQPSIFSAAEVPSPIAVTSSPPWLSDPSPRPAATAGAAVLDTPTRVTYAELQQAYDHLNAALFDAQLPPCLITLQREKRTCGYFSAARFAALDGRMTDEIALNPAFFAVVPLIETLQTLVHEMVHLWQHHHGKPGRGRYHNEQWARKMESIGLMPSSTGRPGGRRTGDCMADYAIEGGRFLQACESLLSGRFTISWYDRFPADEHVAAGLSSMAAQAAIAFGTGTPVAASPALAQAVRPGGRALASVVPGQPPGLAPVPADRSNRLKYTCACRHSVWGKPGLRLRCEDCGQSFAPQVAAGLADPALEIANG